MNNEMKVIEITPGIKNDMKKPYRHKSVLIEEHTY